MSWGTITMSVPIVAGRSVVLLLYRLELKFHGESLYRFGLKIQGLARPSAGKRGSFSLPGASC